MLELLIEDHQFESEYRANQPEIAGDRIKAESLLCEIWESTD